MSNCWIKTKNKNTGKYQLPEEGITVLIKIGKDIHTAWIVFSGDPEFISENPDQECSHIPLDKVSSWQYVDSSKKRRIIEH